MFCIAQFPVRPCKESKSAHCFIHRNTHASKTLPTALQKVLVLVKRIVNFIKAGCLNMSQFKEVCKDMNSNDSTFVVFSKITSSTVFLK